MENQRKKRLNAEIAFWKSLIQNVRDEAQGIECSYIAFHNLNTMAQKYKLPNYELILSNWLQMQNCCFETELNTEQKVCLIMEKLLDAALYVNKKYKKYEILRALHNIPHCMHGASCIQPGFTPISLSEALQYAGLSEYCDGIIP